MSKMMAALLLLMSSMSHAEYALEIQKVSDNVYAIVGELSQRNPENLANNATFGVVVTDEGVLLVDPGVPIKGPHSLIVLFVPLPTSRSRLLSIVVGRITVGWVIATSRSVAHTSSPQRRRLPITVRVPVPTLICSINWWVTNLKAPGVLRRRDIYR
ncbi:hypothetical protein HUE57_09835 [Candidatus Reidiella endopervernicosa]|uniref:MBL fold metallo-hydrolase n=1 Tax=Candidatus Reidiella endopervernicosa TaxID=2738883 RepID=A0A6N0HWA6_9GAMM|nr:hypothetical protein [Candidatus Reidiella endopervernicosa]QKQ26547.1 hypothetical protein HUE57_09835 [Candidatus Reidiella endopervernicosa]